jgi:hypothetical protein
MSADACVEPFSLQQEDAMRTLCFAAILSMGLTTTVTCWGQVAAPGNPGVPWPATDALGRRLPLADEAGLPRADRTVAMFYFLWHEKSWGKGPFDVTKILAADPAARHKNTSPPWGPLLFPHHWGESLFGYYLGDDEAVLKKHAQMLADAGVDVLIFDTSNKATYRHNYTTLMRVFQEARRAGNRTPQVAFLTPFWDPASTVRELYDQLYAPKLYEELWFRWDGKPLILANPALLYPRAQREGYAVPAKLEPGHSLGQSLQIAAPFGAVFGYFPTYAAVDSAVTLTLYRDGPQGPRVVSRRFHDVIDNGQLVLAFDEAQPPGLYYLEASDVQGPLGWWSAATDTQTDVSAYTDGQPVAGDRSAGALPFDPTTQEIQAFFTFRTPQPDYFQGPTGTGQWSWLEVYPQHVFRNAKGDKEQMSVGVAQNAVDNRLGCMSEPNARGRSFHDGHLATEPNAILYGLNVREQWERALQEDPRVVFVTGWNEWIAGRFDEFLSVKTPPIFVDQFDHEHSRDIEPMRGGHGDNYYYQLINYVRRYKGVPAIASVSPQAIAIDGRFDDWRSVTPEFTDTVGDPVERDHAGWGEAGPYVNHTGRNDIVEAKVSFDQQQVYFYVRTREPLSPCTDPNWMWLLIDSDTNAATGWLGYEVLVNGTNIAAEATTLQRNVGGRNEWAQPLPINRRISGNELELAVPRAVLGDPQSPLRFDFKWIDNSLSSGEASDFTLNGDAAPNDRYNFRAQWPAAAPSPLQGERVR